MFTQDQIMVIASLALDLIAAVVAFIIFLIKNKKAKIEKENVNEALSHLEAASKKNSIDIEALVCLSSFTHCPKCGNKLYFRELDFNLEEKENEIQKK